VTGGTGYLGMKVVGELQAVGRDVRVIDLILHGQDDLAAEQRDSGVDLVVADIRDDDAAGVRWMASTRSCISGFGSTVV
jgi:nucleoside-diphosphate-sugar epimerase